MPDLREAIRELTGRELSSDDVRRLNNVARHFGWKQNDPLVDIVMVLDAESRLLAEGFKKIPTDINAIIEKLREAGNRELALCEKKMGVAAELLQSKIISAVVPQIGQSVSEAAAAKIEESVMLTKKELQPWRFAVMIGLCLVCFLFGLLQGSRLMKLPKIQLAASSIAANSLFDAVRSNANPWVLEKLISNGIGVNIVNEHGNTPLLLAVKQDAELDVITTLLEAGADVNAMDKDGATPMMYAIMNTATEPNSGVIAALISAGADVNAKYGEAGITPLMLASKNKKPDIVISALVKAGADIKAKNRLDGKTALDYAKENPALKNSEILLLLEDVKLKPKK